MCSVVLAEVDNIQLEMNKWPVIIKADRCRTNYFHNVNNNLIRDIEQIEGWEAFQVSILYKHKIECTEAEILRELQELWPIFNIV